MRTIPLSGAKAAGRVTRVDDGDYELAMQYRWHLVEKPGTATRRPLGPYANTAFGKVDGRKRFMRLHNLLTGWPLVDHIDHDGLNNQRYNLRPATTAENGQNSRRKITAASQFKGITWDFRDKMWKARIETFGKAKTVGASPIEIEAAYAYDAAARELFGPYACVNFPEGPTEAMREQWRAERAARAAILDAEKRVRSSESRRKFWAQREPETHTCEFCGDEFQTRAVGTIRYCGSVCKTAAYRQRQKELELEGRLF